MKRLIALIAMTLIFGATAHAKDVTIIWHGHSMFEIHSSKGTTIVVDPHFLEAYRPKPVLTDAVLITHQHEDHNDMRSIRNARSAKRFDAVTGLGRRSRWKKIKEEKVNDFTINSVSGMYHDTERGRKRGKMGAFVIEVDGFRIVHLGDLGHKLSRAQIQDFGRVDVLMIPVGGIYTINGAEAKEVVQALSPKYAVLPMHYGTKVYDYLLKPDEFLEDQKNVKRPKGNVWKLTVGSKAPTSPEIIMLDWKAAK